MRLDGHVLNWVSEFTYLGMMVLEAPEYGRCLPNRLPTDENKIRSLTFSPWVPMKPKATLNAFDRAVLDEPNHEFEIAIDFKQRFAGWTVYLFTADLGLPKLLRLKESRKTPFFNGALECRVFEYKVIAGSNRRKAAEEG